MKNDDEDLKQKPSESPDRLEAVAFHLTHLYQRLSQDFDRWAVTGGHLAEAVEIFGKQLHHLETLDEKLRQQLERSIGEGIQRLAVALAQAYQQVTKEVMTQEIKGSVDVLNKAVQDTKHTLQAYQQEVTDTRKWWLIIASISALLGGILGGLTLHYLHF